MDNSNVKHICCPPDLVQVKTVQTVAGIKGLNNCFVYVSDINTTFFVDHAHRITLISSQVVEVKNYDIASNPRNFRNLIVFDTATRDLLYFDNTGTCTNLGASITQEEAQAILSQIATITGTTVQTDTTVEGNGSTVSLQKSNTLLGSGSITTNTMPLPVASSTQAGVMNTATYNAIQTNATDINAILNGAVAISGLDSNPTQQALTEAWKQETGLPTLINRASIYDTDNEKVWYYYTNIAIWKAVNNSGTTDVTVSPFTNASFGTLKGSTEDGQLFAEPNGTGSVNGWDSLNGRVATLEQNAGSGLTEGEAVLDETYCNTLTNIHWQKRGGVAFVTASIHLKPDITLPVTPIIATGLPSATAPNAYAIISDYEDISKLAFANIDNKGRLHLTAPGFLSVTGMDVAVGYGSFTYLCQ